MWRIVSDDETESVARTQSLDSKQSDDKTTQSFKDPQSMESNNGHAMKRNADADEETVTQTFAAGMFQTVSLLMHSCTVCFDLILSSCQTHAPDSALIQVSSA